MTSPLPDRQGLATLALVGFTAIWGATFVVVRDAIAEMPVLPFLFWRFLLATAALVAVRPAAAFRLAPRQRLHGVALGLMLGAGYVLQTFGLETAAATVVGFITGMVVVFTPLIAAAISRRRLPAVVWVSTAMATLGLGLITISGTLATPGRGELLTLACAVVFACHVVGLSRWATGADAYGLTVLQLAVVCAACFAASFTQGGPGVPPSPAVWRALLFLSVAATALAFLAQTWAQSHMSAPRAAIVLTMEPVFAGVFGVTLGRDQLTWRILVGGLLILAAMYIVEVGPRRPVRIDPIATAGT
ncbi:MAG: DMT family transporter [Candidatus Nanopelagicales bacterium]